MLDNYSAICQKKKKKKRKRKENTQIASIKSKRRETTNDILKSTGTIKKSLYTQYLIITYTGEELGKEYVFVCT